MIRKTNEGIHKISYKVFLSKFKYMFSNTSYIHKQPNPTWRLVVALVVELEKPQKKMFVNSWKRNKEILFHFVLYLKNIQNSLN